MGKEGAICVGWFVNSGVWKGSQGTGHVRELTFLKYIYQSEGKVKETKRDLLFLGFLLKQRG